MKSWVIDLKVLELRCLKGLWYITTVDDNDLTDNIKKTNHLIVCERILSCLIHTYNITGLPSVVKVV